MLAVRRAIGVGGDGAAHPAVKSIKVKRMQKYFCMAEQII